MGKVESPTEYKLPCKICSPARSVSIITVCLRPKRVRNVRLDAREHRYICAHRNATSFESASVRSWTMTESKLDVRYLGYRNNLPNALTSFYRMLEMHRAMCLMYLKSYYSPRPGNGDRDSVSVLLLQTKIGRKTYRRFFLFFYIFRGNENKINFTFEQSKSILSCSSRYRSKAQFRHKWNKTKRKRVLRLLQIGLLRSVKR